MTGRGWRMMDDRGLRHAARYRGRCHGRACDEARGTARHLGAGCREAGGAGGAGQGGGSEAVARAVRGAARGASVTACDGRGRGQGVLRRAVRRDVTVFVDASAFIAMIVGEDGADELADALDADGERLCSAVSVWETVAGLCRSYGHSVLGVWKQMEQFFAVIRFQAIRNLLL